MNYQQQLANSAAIRAEIQRFESVHPNIYSIYELLERLDEPVLQNQIREHVIAIEVLCGYSFVYVCVRLPFTKKKKHGNKKNTWAYVLYIAILILIFQGRRIW
ncbi:hypothetical protein XELAEV_18044835mg [Xenopus laevis]|uniref:Uncharacterized protein n=1 Tax=Xenopus laevis TaxID=8355 RepID=A0A974H464_XENLA|nr:hypothetical protein XELAEV_18044835mg [Xenopus laevis]